MGQKSCIPKYEKKLQEIGFHFDSKNFEYRKIYNFQKMLLYNKKKSFYGINIKNIVYKLDKLIILCVNLYCFNLNTGSVLRNGHFGITCSAHRLEENNFSTFITATQILNAKL